MTAPPRPPRWRLIAFAGGDFAFNLYWQSAMLYLLFYYTEALGIAVGTAASLYLAASVWDGVVSLIAGLAIDRRGSARAYRLALTLGAVPLGLAFVFAYTAPAGDARVAFVLAGHMAFRTAYAFVNLSYLAMSARVSAASDDRAFVAGARMLAGTAAAMLVAAGTVPLGRWLTGAAGAPAYTAAAAVFAIPASAILIAVGAGFRDVAPPAAADRPSIRACLASLARNRAFTTLAAAMMAMIVAVTIIAKSVLYYFKYRVGDESAGQLALAVMMAVSAIALPLWMAAARRWGARAMWFVGCAGLAAGLAVFAAADVARAGAMQALLIALQAAIVGLHFAFWALLPDTIEYGQRTTGVRVEGTVFGVAALLQRVAIGLATALLGWSFAGAGYAANVAQSTGTLAGMRATIALVPLAFLGLAAWAMWRNPLARGAHDRIVRELSG